MANFSIGRVRPGIVVTIVLLVGGELWLVEYNNEYQETLIIEKKLRLMTIMNKFTAARSESDYANRIRSAKL